MAIEVCEELSIEIEDKPGALAAALATISRAGVGVRAFCGYSMAGAGNVMVIPTDARKAKTALKKAGYKSVGSSKVVLAVVPDKRGAGANLTERAYAKGINLEYCYATGTGKGIGACVLAAGKDTAKLAKALKS